MTEVIEIEEYLPHFVMEVICLKCLERWLMVAPEGTQLKDLHCPNCGPGYVIGTGQVFDD